jgi:hypothetical protein
MTQDLPPNWITSFLEVYKHLTHCLVVFLFFPQESNQCRLYNQQ